MKENKIIYSIFMFMFLYLPTGEIFKINHLDFIKIKPKLFSFFQCIFIEACFKKKECGQFNIFNSESVSIYYQILIILYCIFLSKSVKQFIFYHFFSFYVIMHSLELFTYFRDNCQQKQSFIINQDHYLVYICVQLQKFVRFQYKLYFVHNFVFSFV